MLLEVLLAWSDELDGNELEADGYQYHVISNAWHYITYPRFSKREMIGPIRPRCMESQLKPMRLKVAVSGT